MGRSGRPLHDLHDAYIGATAALRARRWFIRFRGEGRLGRIPEISIDVDEDVALLAGQLERDEVRRIVTVAFRERASEELMYDVADQILEDSELTDEAIAEMATDLKRRVAERHRRYQVA